jgi:hypothetical protein
MCNIGLQCLPDRLVIEMVQQLRGREDDPVSPDLVDCQRGCAEGQSMLHAPAEGSMLNLVRAVFQANAAFLEMPRIAAFGDLSDRLCHLGEHRNGSFTSFTIADTPPGDDLDPGCSAARDGGSR